MAQAGSCPCCTQPFCVTPVQIPQATNRFLTNQFMLSFHAEILSALRIPVKQISIHSHVPAMTHILLEQRQALGSVEKNSHSRLAWFSACLQLPGLCHWGLHVPQETITKKYLQNKWCSAYYYRRTARAEAINKPTLTFQCNLDSFPATNQLQDSML